MTPANEVVVEETTIAASIERVFEALVNQRDLAAWWTEPGSCSAIHWSVDPRVGGAWLSRWRWEHGGEFAIGGTILRLTRPVLLEYDWWDDRYPGMRTVVRYDLVPTERGTHLKVTHSGFETGRQDLADYRGGWWRVLAKLSAHCAAP